MLFVGDFMMGARSRLLPPSVPFRFFGAAAILQIPAWALLLAFAPDAPAFMGGTGHILASLHLITLGVLLMTAMGASFQLLPVATKKPVRSVAACKTVFWLFLPGVLALAHGMGAQSQMVLEIGATLVIAGIGLFAFLLADNLSRVSDMRAVTDHAWIALAGLLLLAVLGGVLIADFRLGFLPNHLTFAAAHAVVAGYGFMTMLVMGFSFVLVPMFALSPPPDVKLGRRGEWIGAAAILLTAVGLMTDLSALVYVGAACGFGAVGCYLRAMQKVMASRMKKQLGDSFLLIRAAWGLLPLSMAVGLLAYAGVWPDRLVPLFGFLLVFGWLLTFLSGVLQRILPFLASMHSVKKGLKPALVSALTAKYPARIHLVCHGLAVLSVSAGLVAMQPVIVRMGAAFGLAGAVSFAIYAALVWHRLYKHLKNRVQPSENA